MSPDLRDKLKVLADFLVATAVILLMVVVAGCAILLSGCGVPIEDPAPTPTPGTSISAASKGRTPRT